MKHSEDQRFRHRAEKYSPKILSVKYYSHPLYDGHLLGIPIV